MTRVPRPMAWLGAGALSLAVHAAVLGIVAAALAPDPTVETRPVEARLRLSTESVRRDTAAQAEPAGAAAAEAAAGRTVGQGAVPVQRAETVTAATPAASAVAPQPVATPPVVATAPADRAAAVTPSPAPALAPAPPPGRISAAAPRADPLPAADPPAAPSVVARRPPDGAALAAGSPLADPVPVRRPGGVAVVAASATDRAAEAAPVLATSTAAPPADGAAVVVSATAPGGPVVSGADAVADAAPLPADLAAQATAAPVRPPAGVPAPRPRPSGLAVPSRPAGALAARASAANPASLAHTATAALAWSGGDAGALDPQSIAAIQTFTAPSPAAAARAGGGSVRDRLGETLAGVPCSRLQAALVPESGGIEVRGHVPAAALREQVRRRLEAAVGGALPIRTNLLVLPPPQCGVLRALDGLALPQSRDQADDPLAVGRAAQAGIARFRAGDLLQLQVEAPAFDAWIHLDYFDGEGRVIHLTPSRHAPVRFVPAGDRFTFGGRTPGGGGPVMRVVPPFGQEIAVVFGTTHPIQDVPRPPVEDAAVYLRWLDQRLRTLTRTRPGFRGEWAYVFVETRP
ncbi:DUF4384 domain-containing protein [Roseospira goensis]|uniref:DUF4384 domain-containing protein n=1 Tax=Roseospira goensis TaxID=391922 RepID=A0A7W6RXE1_9PROT|nr:DUF4384 domain-containing protein [Roseospira goensis]MBB4284846.1 hypothetical protein [Roseospira goensis]